MSFKVEGRVGRTSPTGKDYRVDVEVAAGVVVAASTRGFIVRTKPCNLSAAQAAETGLQLRSERDPKTDKLRLMPSGPWPESRTANATLAAAIGVDKRKRVAVAESHAAGGGGGGGAEVASAATTTAPAAAGELLRPAKKARTKR